MDFFHEWDNAVFKKRDMHPELAEFLDLCSEDIPMKKRLEIQFYVANTVPEKKKETLICASYHTFYNFLYRIESRKLSRIFKRSMVLLLTALALILLHIVLGARMDGEVWTELFLEGLLIGGWVFMWEALHMSIFESSAPLMRRREIMRFQRAELKFKYDER